MTKFRGVVLALILATLSLVWTGSTISAEAAPKGPPGAVVLDDSDCLDIFDAWTNDLTGKTFIAYYGSDHAT